MCILEALQLWRTVVRVSCEFFQAQRQSAAGVGQRDSQPKPRHVVRASHELRCTSQQHGSHRQDLELQQQCLVRRTVFWWLAGPASLHRRRSALRQAFKQTRAASQPPPPVVQLRCCLSLACISWLAGWAPSQHLLQAASWASTPSNCSFMSVFHVNR